MTAMASDSSQNSPSPLVSVIIPVLNDVEGLQRCLHALAQQTLPQSQYTVIVVDNGASEAIKACVSQFPFCRYEGETVRSSYAARNTGIKASNSPIIAFTDADCLPTPTWLERGIATLQSTPNCGLVAGQIELFPQDVQTPKAVELFDMITEMRQDKFVKQWGFGATANVLTFRQIIDTVGLFNATLKSGGDMEWGTRVKRAGYAVVYDARAIVRHPTRSSWQAVKSKTIRVIGGVHDVFPPKSVIQLVKEIRDDWPQWWNLKEIYHDERLVSPTMRWKVMGVTLGVKWVRAQERIRLFFGGRSQNL